VKRLLLVVVLLPVFVLLAPAAPAAAPDQHGWWTTFGSSPDVPADGLLIQGGTSPASPSAFGAVVYSVPDGSQIGKLTLVVAPSSASIPLTKLELCPLTSTIFTAAQGGAMADAPKFDCQRHVTAEPAASGATYEFDVASLVGNGSLALAILPTSPTDRVVLSAPDGNSLALTAASARTGASSGGSVTSPVPSGSPSYAAPAPVTASPPPSISEPLRSVAQPGRNAAAEYVPTLVAGVRHARGAAVVLVIAGALVIGGGWLVIGRISVQRALAEGTSE
jgi:hypothetical protein